MTKAQKYKKIMSLVKTHGEITVYLEFKHQSGLFRRRKIRDDGWCFTSEGCYHLGLTDYRDSEWGKYGSSCFVVEDGGARSLSRTMALMSNHDRGLLNPIAIKIRNKEIKL